jgi:hypothetical protein
MKKIVNLSIAIVLALGLLLANAPQKTVAADVGSHPLVADGAWNTGTEVAVDLTVTSAPSWMQLLTNGVKITAPAKICHPFNGGRFGWVGEIRQLVKGEWVKLPTVSDWVPTTEGVFTACAQAPAAGTYALFGYWIRPAGYVEEPETVNLVSCPDTSEWKAFTVRVPPDPWHFSLSTPNLPAGLPVTFELLAPVDSNYVGPTTGSGTTSAIPPLFLTIFLDSPFTLIDKEHYFNSKIRFTFPSLNCYWDDDFSK